MVTFLRRALPDGHLGAESRDLVRLTMGLPATMSALVVGLLITTAKTSCDTQGGEFRRMSAEIVLLDRALAHYGPTAQPARDDLRRTVTTMLRRMEFQGRAAGRPAQSHRAIGGGLRHHPGPVAHHRGPALAAGRGPAHHRGHRTPALPAVRAARDLDPPHSS